MSDNNGKEASQVIDEMIQKRIDETLRMIYTEVEQKYNVDKIIHDYFSSRGEMYKRLLVDIVEKNGGIPQLTGLFETFYKSGEFINFQNVWLFATKPEYRADVMKVIAVLYVAGDLLQATLEKEKGKKAEFTLPQG
ncbi:MAG: hypothetical protein QXG05_08085 [Nitrososphaerota archaeon]